MTDIKGIIFDFNGTLFLDSALHEDAWIKIAAKIRKQTLTLEEFQLNGHGRTNKTIISYLLGHEPEINELEQIVEEKESLYRKMCLANKDSFKLAPGVIPFLDAVKSKDLPITIATGSYIKNVDFYFTHLNLAKWFNRNLVVLDDGTYPGKPAPDIFQIAAEKLNLKTSECLVIEDSYSGIESAYHAGIKKIIAVEPTLNRAKFNIDTNQIDFYNSFKDITIDF